MYLCLKIRKVGRCSSTKLALLDSNEAKTSHEIATKSPRPPHSLANSATSTTKFQEASITRPQKTTIRSLKRSFMQPQVLPDKLKPDLRHIFTDKTLWRSLKWNALLQRLEKTPPWVFKNRLGIIFCFMIIKESGIFRWTQFWKNWWKILISF